MTNRAFLSLGLSVLLLFNSRADAADAKAELEELIGKVKTKLQAGKKSEQDLAEESKASTRSWPSTREKRRTRWRRSLS
jgi:hypothetical protein